MRSLHPGVAYQGRLCNRSYSPSASPAPWTGAPCSRLPRTWVEHDGAKPLLFLSFKDEETCSKSIGRRSYSTHVRGSRDPGFPCTRPFPATACAAFCAESRMECINATDLHRKSGGTWGTRPGARACGRTEERWCDEQKTCLLLGIGFSRAQKKTRLRARRQRQNSRPVARF